MSCDNILQCPAGLYMYVCISVHTHIHIRLPTHVHTQIISVPSWAVLLCHSVVSIMFGTHFLEKTGEMVGKKMVGLIMSEILLLRLYTGMNNFLL